VLGQGPGHAERRVIMHFHDNIKLLVRHLVDRAVKTEACP
jgi:hypothetical protein